MKENINEVLGVAGKSTSEVFPKAASQDDNSAENTLIVIATIVLVCGIIAAVICLFTVAFIQDPEFHYTSKKIFNPAGFATTIMVLLSSLISWGFLKVLANISLTLKEINHKTK